MIKGVSLNKAKKIMENPVSEIIEGYSGLMMTRIFLINILRLSITMKKWVTKVLKIKTMRSNTYYQIKKG